MSRLTIFTADEIKQFDRPPCLSLEQQHKYFAITPQVDSLIKRLRSDINAICTVIQWGYFRATGRFFQPKDFHRTDIRYVATLLDREFDAVEFANYCQKPKTSREHERRVLQAIDFAPFDQSAKTWLIAQITHLSEKHMPPREMIAFLSAQLHQQKIEIPGYYTFAELITQQYNHVEQQLLATIKVNLTDEQASLLQSLVYAKDNVHHPLAKWKHINQSLLVKD